MEPVKNRDGSQTFGVTNTFDKKGNSKLGSDFTNDVRGGVTFKVNIDNSMSTEGASGTISHEMTLHVVSETQRVTSLAEQLDRNSLHTETVEYAKGLNNVYQPHQDHMVLTGGQANGYLNIMTQLDKLQKINGTHLNIYKTDMKAQKSIIDNARRIYGQK